MIMGLSLAVTVLGAGAPAGAAGCPRVSDPNVSVRVVDPGPRVISTKSLQQIGAMAGSHGLMRKGFRVLGITTIKIDSGINVRYQGTPVSNGVCVHVKSVTVRFGLKNHYVHVPREYPRDTCKFRVVLRHEMEHVDVNRRTVRKYALILKNEVRSALRRNGAIGAPDMTRGQNALTALVQQKLDEVTARFVDERTALHAAIDDPKSKNIELQKCSGW